MAIQPPFPMVFLWFSPPAPKKVARHGQLTRPHEQNIDDSARGTVRIAPGEGRRGVEAVATSRRAACRRDDFMGKDVGIFNDIYHEVKNEMN